MAFSSWGRLARFTVFVAVASTISGALVAQEKPAERGGEAKAAASSASTVAAPDSITEGTVTVSGQAIAYRAVAGTITVGATDQQDATLAFDGSLLPDSGVKAPDRSRGSAADRAHFLCGVFQEGHDGSRTIGR